MATPPIKEDDIEKPKNLKELPYLTRLEVMARQNGLEKGTKKSYDWFRKKMVSLGGDKARRELQKTIREQGRMKSFTTAGHMCSFVYDAKTKDKMPYWDAFPLIIMVDFTPNGFYGLNMHYLSPQYRAILFDALTSFQTNTKYDDKTRLKFTYAMLRNASKYKYFRPCFKRYLWDHVKTPFMKIHPNEWEVALMMPTADFQKGMNSKIWSDSVLMARDF